MNHAVSIAGRITSIRLSSKTLWFLDVNQDLSRIQLVLNKSIMDDFEGLEVTRGDIIMAEGVMTRTLTGELSVRVRQMKILSPCQINLPDSKLDTENRIRHRHLDMLSDSSFIGVLKKRAEIIGGIRRFLEVRGFIEVETPILNSKYGGANARPFTTQHIHDVPLFMRIAPELSLKQLVVGGLDRVYEMGKVFRNEGLDADHNPEFTSCEFYQAYSNCTEMMDFVESMICNLGLFKGPFRRIDIVAALERITKEKLPLDLEYDEAQLCLRKLFKKLGIQPSDTLTLPKMYDKLISHLLEPLCDEPTFLTGHPMILSPLATNREEDDMIADRFEFFVKGREIANGFSEQTDPTEQLNAFKVQARERDDEAQPLDMDFVEVLKAGLPPTAGCGIGIDRLVMLATGKSHIRDVLAFPSVRPKHR